MKTFQMTFDEQLKTTRSAFTRETLKNAIKSIKIKKLEHQHKNGYQKNPVKLNEFSIWEDEQEWGVD